MVVKEEQLIESGVSIFDIIKGLLAEVCIYQTLTKKWSKQPK